MGIVRTDIFTFRYFDYGEAFHGSYRGMRYMIGREPLEWVFGKSEEEKAEGSIRVYIWPEPFAFDQTDDDKKTFKDFPYSEDGVVMAIDYLNEVWEEEYAGA